MNCLAAGTPVRVQNFKSNRISSSSSNQYQLGQLLARTGSMNAEVCLATQKNGKTVAIKRYNVDRHLTETGEDLSPYIQHEVAAMKMLRHSNILPCLASFVVGEQVWLVSPLMSLGSVDQLIKNYFNQGLPELVCCFILRDVLQALQYLHLQGVVHRSVRCSHILLEESGRALLGGFRYSTSLHATGENKSLLYDYPLHGIQSNLCWLAPEILKQNLLGYCETSDIYSLGIAACEMGNGLVPYSDFPPTLMLVEKIRGSAPRLMDATTLLPDQQEGEEDEEEEGSVGGPQLVPADSGVGQSVGSANNILRKNSSFLNREFSAAFHDLVAECTVSSGDERHGAEELLHHPFIKQLKKTSVNLVTLLHPLQPLEVDQGQGEEGLVIEQLDNISLDHSEDLVWDFNSKQEKTEEGEN